MANDIAVRYGPPLKTNTKYTITGGPVTANAIISVAAFDARGNVLYSYGTKADSSGNWSAQLPPVAAYDAQGVYYQVADGTAKTKFTVPSSGGPTFTLASQTIASNPSATPPAEYFATNADMIAAVTAASLAANPSAAAAPTTGAHARGERVWNNAPVASGTLGWVCVTAGTPGTWKTFGTIGA